MDGQLVCGRRVKLEPVENRSDQWGGAGRGGTRGQARSVRYRNHTEEGAQEMATQEREIREHRLQQDGDDDDSTEQFWREYTLDLQSKGSYIPRHLRKFVQ